MTANYVLLERIQVGEAGAASVTFNNIPQSGYTDLKIAISSRSTASGDFRMYVYPKGLSTNLTSINLYATGSSAASNTYSNGAIGFFVNANDQTASTFGNGEIYFPNYTSSNYKSFSVDGVTETNGTGAYSGLSAGLWSSTAAITSLTLQPTSGSFMQYSTFSLYGLAAVGTTPVIAPYASGGDIIETDGTYWYHAFLSSGTFTPAKALSCDYLVVAGGGGGGADDTGGNYSGGGGAGGLRSTVTATGGGGSLESAVAMALNTAYTITIGAGGAGGTNGGGNVPANGGNSSLIGGSVSITSLGGGRGSGINGTPSWYDATSGGSGGGNSEGGSAPYPGTTGQGYAGGYANGGYPGNLGAGGGGGGAGGLGGDGTGAGGTRYGGTGGAAVTITALATPTSTGVSGAYAGGGGGSGNSGGGSATGGGGAGAAGATTGGSATPNTGGGGGAGLNAGKGGSGIIIVRYAI